MKDFINTFKDNIDMTDGTVVINAKIFKEIQSEAYNDGRYEQMTSKSVTELCADNPNLKEYISQLEKELKNVKDTHSMLSKIQDLIWTK